VSVVEEAEVLLVYDKECPACDQYVRVMRVRESVGRFEIVDAREDTPVMREITAAGLDVDEGMVLKMGDTLYYGSDAIHALALISSRSGIINKLNYWVFRSRRLSGVLYPVLRACRGVLLKMLRKTRINNLDVEGRDRF
jgi:predicted DCC family thiol-disulfide oxidoreductase YuxK